tara:strand:- start:19 stop:348 length:330 start_codon:yes stop_codon:yes gene_type:complete
VKKWDKNSVIRGIIDINIAAIPLSILVSPQLIRKNGRLQPNNALQKQELNNFAVIGQLMFFMIEMKAKARNPTVNLSVVKVIGERLSTPILITTNEELQIIVKLISKMM